MRLFVAIELNDEVRELALRAAALLSQAGVRGRYEHPEKLHVTVAFLGNVHDDRLDAVVEAFRGVARQRPFSIDFDRVGAFPDMRRPHTIWIGSSQDNTAFAVCAQTVRAAFEALGFRFEQRATPHVTICRLKRTRVPLLPEIGAAAHLPVGGLTLFQSLPAGQTTRYEAIDRTRFAM